MKVEDANALRFILQDEIYLINDDKIQYSAPAATPAVIETPKPVFNYLGSNKKNFLVLVSYPDHDFIIDEHLAALESVLSRIGQTRDDVAILNVAKHEWAGEQELLSYFEPKTLVILGKRALPHGIGELQFNMTEKRGTTGMLYTFSFDEMMTNVDNKKAFWEQIKNI